MVIFSQMDANSVLIFIGMIAGMYVYWRKGGNQASSEIISMYKARDEIQDKERKEMRDSISNLTGEVGRLKGLIEEKDKRIAILESVDIQRNPVMAKFIKRMEGAAEESEAFMMAFKDMPQILGEIKTFMEKINAHMEKQH